MQNDFAQILLPFAEREYIDVNRTARILGISPTTVFQLYKAGLIDMIDYRKGARKRVRYQSVVDFCDALRIRFCIADRRPKIENTIFRHRDEDLLPFPLADTIYMDDCMRCLQYSSRATVIKIVEEGRFEAYMLMRSSIWRISKSSFAKFLAASHTKRQNVFSENSSRPIQSSPALHSITPSQQ